MYKNKYFQLAMAASLTTVALVAVAPTADARFSDVTPNTEAAQAINKLVHKGVVKGFPDGTFKPKNGVTRGEFAKIISIVNTGQSQESADFSGGRQAYKDVPNTHWAYGYVSYTNLHRLLEGYPNGNFGVNDPLTRGQFASIMVKQLKMDIPNISLPFKDVPKGAWYEDGVKLLLDLGITTGTSATTFSPNAPITREQLAIFLDRAGLLGDETGLDSESVSEIDEIGPLAALAPYLDQTKVHNKEDFKSFKEIAKDDSILTPTNYDTSKVPFISFYDDKVEVTKAGEYVYKLHVLGAKTNPAYLLFVTFNNKDIESFKLYTRDQFEQKVKTTLKGPAAFEKEVKTKYGYDVRVNIPGGMVGSISFNDDYSNSYNYYDFFDEKPIYVSIQQPQIHGVTHYVLTPSWNGELYDFTFEEMKPLTIKIPDNYANYRTETTWEGDEIELDPDKSYTLLSYTDENDSVHIFPYIVSNDSLDEIPINGQLKLTYTLEGSSKEQEIVYIYKGNYQYELEK